MNLRKQYGWLCLFFGIGLSFTGAAQQRVDLAPSIKGDFKLPVTTGPKAFSDILDGVIDIDVSGNYPLQNGLMFGVGGKVTYFEINDIALAPEVTDGNAVGLSFYGKAGYEKLMGANSFAELSMNFGYSTYMYETRQCDGKKNNSGLFLEPRAAIYFFASEQLAFGLIATYQFIFQDFGQEQLCLDKLPKHVDGDTGNKFGIFTIGFGFSAGLKRSASVFH